MVVRISIHAPVKGATFSVPARAYRLSDFNPRTREGCDSIICLRSIPNFLISIHAPVKGATIGQLRRLIVSQAFQSTHP